MGAAGIDWCIAVDMNRLFPFCFWLLKHRYLVTDFFLYFNSNNLVFSNERVKNNLSIAKQTKLLNRLSGGLSTSFLSV